MERTAQAIQATQKTFEQEFESLSSALQSLVKTVRNKKIPSPLTKAQQWLDKTKKAVAALALNTSEIENSQRVRVTKIQKAAASSRQEGEALLQQGLSQDQQEQVLDATSTLKKHLQKLEAAFTTHLQGTQKRLSDLEDLVQQSEQTVVAMKKAPAPPRQDHRTAQLATLETDTVSLKKKIISNVQNVRNFYSGTHSHTR